MYKWTSSTERLNQHVSFLPGQEVSYRIYYWGANPSHYDNPLHKHSFWEVCYVVNGKGMYEDAGTLYELLPNTLFISRPEILHQIRSEKGLELLYVAFDLLNPSGSSSDIMVRFERLKNESVICRYADHPQPAAYLWQSLLVPEQDGEAMRAEQLPELARVLLSSFADVFSRQRSQEAPALRRHHTLLQQAKLYIRDNLDQTLTLESVASYLHVSKRHLSRLFAEGIHETYSRFVQEERILKAAYLLQQTDLPIQLIAEQTGFSSVHAFTRAFTSKKQQSPGRFRNTHRNPNPPGR